MSLPFRVLGVNHAGLAPKDPARAKDFFASMLGLFHLGDEHVVSQKTMTSMFSSSGKTSPSGSIEPRLEILADDGSPDGPIGKFLDKRGAGIHHLALTVDSVDQALIWLKKNGVRLIDQEPRPGAHNTRIAFIHPEATGGLLLELVEESPHPGPQKSLA